MSVKDRFYTFILGLQQEICSALEAVDGQGLFAEDRWDRPGGGGGISRIISHGKVFEKGGVSTSAVYGDLPDSMRQALKVEGQHFYACGLSIVLHPVNPFVPTIHANWRYFELTDGSGNTLDTWFGGGSDLTPYYLVEEDGRHFHTTLKQTMDPFGADLYAKYKDQCDHYFINRHRDNEARGIGGVFYDYLRPENDEAAEKLLAFQQANGHAFLPSYLPIVEKRKDTLFGENEIAWQEIRRGRYAEFNLVHDRGTLFGLKTNGRIESILMSMPPRARWEYNHHPSPGSREAQLLDYLRPREWIS